MNRFLSTQAHRSGSITPRQAGQRIVLAVAIVCSVMVSAVRANDATQSEMAMAFPLAEVAAPETPIASKVRVAPLNAALESSDIMRSRPFVLGATPCVTFCVLGNRGDARDMLSPDDSARAALARFQLRRGATNADVARVLERFDDPRLSEIAPAGNLRAALLMLTGWEPYSAVLTAILDGENPSGVPFGGLRFAPLNEPGAVATHMTDSDGTPIIVFDAALADEPPAHLIPLLIHETLHDSLANSLEEEIIANLLGTVAYAELLLIEPAIALDGTPLAVANNMLLLALLNSTGRAGPAALGLTASPLGDVWFGEGFDQHQARSFRDAIAQQPFYATLPTGGSPGNALLGALLERLPGAASVTEPPSFDEATLALLDREIATILNADRIVQLAAVLRLGVTELTLRETPPRDLPLGPSGALAARPFAPRDTARFRPALAQPASPLREDTARWHLGDLLRRGQLDPGQREATVVWFDDARLQATAPEASARAGILALAVLPEWNLLLDHLVPERTTDPTWRVEFVDLAPGVPIAQGTDRSGAPIIQLDTALAGEHPSVIATYLIEGALLHDPLTRAGLTGDQVVVAALFGTLAWTDFLRLDERLVDFPTAGAIARNRETLALLNSTSVTGDGDTLGVLAPTGSERDVLPSLFADAESFAEYITTQGRLVAVIRRPTLTASPLAREAAMTRGFAPIADTITQRDFLMMVDERFALLLTPRAAFEIARVLELGVDAPHVAVGDVVVMEPNRDLRVIA